MTNPKPAESRVVAGGSKPPAASATKADRTIEKSTKDAAVATDPPPPDPNVLLAQFVSLTQSISSLVQQNAETGDDQANDTVERKRVVFAYDFLGVVVGRRAPSLFKLNTVDVDRAPGTLTFNRLGDAKVARIRAANNTVRILQGLTDGVAVDINQGENAIPDNQRIDSIVTFISLGGVPVAIGPCLGPEASYVA